MDSGRHVIAKRETNTMGTEQTGNETREDMVATLIQAAGRRENPPQDAYEETLAIATDSWQKKVRQRHNRQRVYWAAAASVVAAIAVAWLVNTGPVNNVPQVASMDRIIGSAEIKTGAHAKWSVLRDEDHKLINGTAIRTHDGSYAGIMLDGGISLRMAVDTEILIDTASRIQLISGKVYLDTGSMNGTPNQIAIVTPAGTAWDLGTQFEVIYRDDSYRLRVREGTVVLDSGGEEIQSAAGEQLLIDAQGDYSRSRVSPDDPEWKWAESLAPALDIEGKPVSDLVAWVSRETGRSVHYSNKNTEKKSERTILHGNIRHLAPMDALSVMLATTDLEHIVEDDGTILIRAKSN